MAIFSTKWNRFHYLIVDDLVISVKVLVGVEEVPLSKKEYIRDFNIRFCLSKRQNITWTDGTVSWQNGGVAE